MIKLSVIIPVYNDRENLSRCLDAIEKSLFKDYQLIVVDDGSSDGSGEVAKDRCDLTICLDENMGQSRARNQGALQAEADLLFFLDADVMVEADTLNRILAVFSSNPEVSALFCSYQSDTPSKNFVSQYKNLQHHFTHQIARREASTFCGGFGAIRRDVFLSIGGFEEHLRFMEDVQLGYRLNKDGHRILLCPSIQLTHNKKYSLYSLLKSDIFQRAVPWTKLMLKRRVYNNDLNTSSNNIASVVVVFLMLLALLFHSLTALGFVLLEFGLLSTLILLNLKFLMFMQKARGTLFALRAIPMLWLQYAYSGFGLALGILAHVRDRLRGP
jgi:GT2 family glycosyltransferase